MHLDLNINEMSLEELRECSRNLIRLAKADAELINTMRNIIDLTENQQGE